MITKDIIIGTAIILINLVPLVMKKYNFIPITAAISLFLVLLNIAI